MLASAKGHSGKKLNFIYILPVNRIVCPQLIPHIKITCKKIMSNKNRKNASVTSHLGTIWRHRPSESKIHSQLTFFRRQICYLQTIWLFGKVKNKKIKIIKKHNKPPFDNYYSKIQCYFRMFYIILGILEIVHALWRECVFLILVYQLSKT